MTRPLNELLFGCKASGAAHRANDIPDIATKVLVVKDAGVSDYIERCPPDEEFRALLTASERHDLPVLAGGWFYTAGRDEPPFERNNHKARLPGCAVHNVQAAKWHAGGHVASNQDIADFYCWAHEVGMRHDVVLSFEVHVNMWSEHVGRIAQVAALVQARGLPFRMTLDHSQGIFKIDNPKEQEVQGMKADADADAGRVVLDPALPGNVCE